MTIKYIAKWENFLLWVRFPSLPFLQDVPFGHTKTLPLITWIPKDPRRATQKGVQFNCHPTFFLCSPSHRVSAPIFFASGF